MDLPPLRDLADRWRDEAELHRYSLLECENERAGIQHRGIWLRGG